MMHNKDKMLINKSIESPKFKSIYKSSKTTNKKRLTRLNYIGFFFLYFSISVIKVYLVVYLPVFLLNILIIDRSQLAFIQIFVYLVMFSGPIIGLFLDKYSKNKKIIIMLSSIVFLVSFLISVLEGMNLSIFGLFLAINLITQELIKVGISKLIIDHSVDEGIKDSNLTAINISSNVGAFIPSVVFLYTVNDIFNLNEWNLFFFIGFLCSIPIIFSTIIMRETNHNSKEFKRVQEGENGFNFESYNIFNSFMLFLSYFMIWSDKIYQFPFSSWILTRFGAEGFNLYSLLYIFLIFLNIGGWIIGQRISHRDNNYLKKKSQDENLYSIKLVSRKRIIEFIIIVYTVLTFLMAFSDFFLLMIIQGIIQIIAGIMMLNYTSLMMSISTSGKYKTFKFQCLKIAYAFSCIIFLPLG
ncbi:MAG: hypothetical protein ACFFD7_15460, partial [Candidatus Thorarchaeota archaeon]